MTFYRYVYEEFIDFIVELLAPVPEAMLSDSMNVFYNHLNKNKTLLHRNVTNSLICWMFI